MQSKVRRLILIDADFKHDLIQSTALLAGFSSIAFGLFTNMPVALA